MRTITEVQLIRALRSGDEAALEEIIQQYTSYVGAIVRGIIGGAMTDADAQEVLSDVFLALWQNAAKLRPGKLKAYLASIARSRAKNKLRQRRCELYIEDDQLAVSPSDPQRRLAQKEESRAVARAVDALSPRDRELFLRHYYLCRTAREIAGELDENLFTVQSAIRRARERFKNNLIKGGYFSDDEDFKAP